VSSVVSRTGANWNFVILNFCPGVNWLKLA
jgi:hypothetical protein